MNPPWKTALKFVAVLGLVMTVVSGVLVLGGAISSETHSALLVVGMFMWFGSAIFWIESKPLGD